MRLLAESITLYLLKQLSLAEPRLKSVDMKLKKRYITAAHFAGGKNTLERPASKLEVGVTACG